MSQEHSCLRGRVAASHDRYKGVAAQLCLHEGRGVKDGRSLELYEARHRELAVAGAR